MSGLVLYTYELDEDSYRARLLLSLLKLEWTPVAVNMFPLGQHKSPEMLALDPRGNLPVLKDGELVLSGVLPVLCYIAQKFDTAKTLLPPEPDRFGHVMAWLEFSATTLRANAAARLALMFGEPGDVPALQKAARTAFRIMDDTMTGRQLAGQCWFAGDTLTLADIALVPAFALSRDYGIEHEEYPALRAWLRRMRGLPGFRTMPGIPDYW